MWLFGKGSRIGGEQGGTFSSPHSCGSIPTWNKPPMSYAQLQPKHPPPHNSVSGCLGQIMLAGANTDALALSDRETFV